MALKAKPNSYPWLYLFPRLCTLRSTNSGDNGDSLVPGGYFGRKKRGGRNHVTIDARYKHDVVGPVPSRRAGKESRIREVQVMRVGWSHALLSSCYPRASKHLTANFERDIRKLPVGFFWHYR